MKRTSIVQRDLANTFNYVHIIDTQHIYIHTYRINAYIHTHIHARHERFCALRKYELLVVG